MLKNKAYGSLDLIYLAFKVSPLWASISFILQFLNFFMPGLLVIATAHFIDVALQAVTLQTAENQFYQALLLLCLAIAFPWFVTDIRPLLSSKLIMASRTTYQLALIEKRTRLDYRLIEDAASYDLIERVLKLGEEQVMMMFNQTMGLIHTVMNALSLALILWLSVWWVPFVILLFSVPIFYMSFKAGQRTYDADREVSDVKRQGDYLLKIASDRSTSDERFLFGFGHYLSQKLSDRFATVNGVLESASVKTYRQMGLGGMVVALIGGLVMIVLLQPVASGTMSIGLFMAAINGMISLVQAISWRLTFQMKSFARNREYLKDLTEFLNLEEVHGVQDPRVGKIPVFESLEFKSVSFVYPQTEKKVLDQVSFKLIAGRHYAFVGENGSGKTTIIKLITGLYRHYEGEILLNGKDLKGYEQAELKSFFSIAYQDFARYELSVKENIMLGDLQQHSDARIEAVIEQLDLSDFIRRLPKKIDTLLGKMTETGVDASGGQWQRIALARVSFSRAPLQILDEPTAALDPMNESRLYEQFEKISREKTTIFISHRLGSTKLADEILVFASGKLIEIGDHHGLLKTGQLYAKMYHSQAQWYQNTEVKQACL
ncbi:MAG: ABC transporter ATP-binding protein/permease [Defluviitaleaceae bacterium]|nr:ABC transporter ATP-binding protein/permease [Defluviitaleaceae bacterium]